MSFFIFDIRKELVAHHFLSFYIKEDFLLKKCFFFLSNYIFTFSLVHPNEKCQLYDTLIKQLRIIILLYLFMLTNFTSNEFIYDRIITRITRHIVTESFN